MPNISTDHYDPDYEFLQQDLSDADQLPHHMACNLSPLPESASEACSPFLGSPFQLPPGGCSLLPLPDAPSDLPPALPEKKRRSAASQTSEGSSGCRVSYERHPSQYDNISEADLRNPGTFPPFAAVLPFPQGEFTVPEPPGDSEKPPPLPEKKNKHSKFWGCVICFTTGLGWQEPVKPCFLEALGQKYA